MDEVDMNFHLVRFNGSFAHENIYRREAGPETDEAWKALGIECKYRDAKDSVLMLMLITSVVIDRPVVLPESLAIKSGLNSDHVKVKKMYGGGYPVFVEGLHQLHCLVGALPADLC